MTDQPATPNHATRRKRAVAVALAASAAFILGFVLAWWLRRSPLTAPACAQTRQSVTGIQSSPGAGGGMHGGGVPGTGSPVKLGTLGGGSGSLSGSGAAVTGNGAGTPPGGGGSGDGELPGGGLNNGAGHTVANGSAGTANGGVGNGDMDSGGGDGRAPSGNDRALPPPAAASATAPNGIQPVTASSGATPPSATPGTPLAVDASAPGGRIATALDYRYDRSGLPHYPNAVKVASGTDAAAAAAAAGSAGRNFSVTEILTDDAPDAVAAWYHQHLPAGWTELSMPGAMAMDQAIEQTKAHPPTDSPVDSMLKMISGAQLVQAKPGVDAARAAGLTIFRPADQHADPRMILVIRDSKTGKTGVLLMKKVAS